MKRLLLWICFLCPPAVVYAQYSAISTTHPETHTLQSFIHLTKEIPSSQKQVIFDKKGRNQGYYVVVGTYHNKKYAREMLGKAIGKGYMQSRMFHSKITRKYYLYVLRSYYPERAILRWKEIIKDPEYGLASLIFVD